LLALLAVGCASADRSVYPPKPGELGADAIVFSNHWHTGVIVRTADLPALLREDLKEFGQFPYLAFGWGDTDFYRAAHVTPWLAVRALFLSRGVVLLVIGLPSEPEEAFASDIDIYRARISGTGYERMITAIAGSFERADGKTLDRGPGEEGMSHFYAGVGRYNASATCNVWTAKMLRTAGLPISPTYALTADNIEYQIGRIPGALKNGRPFPPSVNRIAPIPRGGNGG